MAAHILIGFAAAAAWVLFLYVSPFGRCWRCRGRGNVKRGHRRPVCPRCHGRKRGQRTGSRTVHRTVRMVRAELARTRKLKESKP
jgi:DnaJ-class molecular chaperone